VHYLPLDTTSDASKWLDYTNPSLAVFVRYDIWPNHLNALRKRGVPSVVMAMSAPKTPWYLHRSLPLIRMVYKEGIHSWGVISAQDAANMSLAGIHSEVLGNPKFDYAASLVGKTPTAKFLAWKKAQNKPILLVGSAHIEDCQALNRIDLSGFSTWVVPHEIDQVDVLKKTMKQFQNVDSANSITDNPKETSLLMVPEFGVLSGLYSLADGVIIGGGYNKATHNVLEATVQGKIVASGPNWQKIAENHELLEMGYLIPAQTIDQYSQYLKRIGTQEFSTKGEQAKQWLLNQKGASERILNVLEQSVQL
jgi:3-deoxy-D-manno-octulosonic-acid transferase